MSELVTDDDIVVKNGFDWCDVSMPKNATKSQECASGVRILTIYF
jgi:hypothetical protein